MHIYFSGIGGTGIGPLALVAKEAGFTVSGSDKQDSDYIAYLRKHGLNDIHIGQDYQTIKSIHELSPIDWFVYTSALTKENPDSPELRFCQENGIKSSKRDEFLNHLLAAKNLKLIAIAGTHGKTTTTAMAIWTLQQLDVPISYILPAKSSFADMGHFEPGSEFFVYECDEYDRNFLSFRPHISLISGIDYDHPDIYPTIESYNQAFHDFLSQSKTSVMWLDDAKRIGMGDKGSINLLDKDDPAIGQISLPGKVNRQNAWLVASGLSGITNQNTSNLVNLLIKFPGVSRRFEKIIDNLYSDYAHTPPKIRGALETAREVAKKNVIVVYEGLHNTRQHFIKDELFDLFSDADQLYVVPSYLAREDKSLKLLAPADLISLMSKDIQSKAEAADKNDALKRIIAKHVNDGDTVLCLTAGGGGSLDEWLRREFVSSQK